MFAHISSLFMFLLFALPLLAAARAVPHAGTPTVNQCNTGSLQCCNSVQAANNSGIAALLGLLGIVAGDITGLVGSTCSPITVIGAGSNSCTVQPVCCTNNNFNGLVALGCTPINISL